MSATDDSEHFQRQVDEAVRDLIVAGIDWSLAGGLVAHGEEGDPGQTARGLGWIIGVGAVIGGVVGTFVLPGYGTAGLAVIGAISGKWIGTAQREQSRDQASDPPGEQDAARRRLLRGDRGDLREAAALVRARALDPQSTASLPILSEALRAALWPALKGGSDDALPMAKVCTPILLARSLAGRIPLPPEPLVFAMTVVAIARNGAAAACRERNLELPAGWSARDPLRA